MASDVHSVGLDCCSAMVLNAVTMVQSTYRTSYNSVPTTCWDFVFHTFKVQRCCHNMVHIVLWCFTEVLSID